MLEIKVKIGFDCDKQKEIEAIAKIDTAVAQNILEHMFNAPMTYSGSQKLLKYWGITWEKITKE